MRLEAVRLAWQQEGVVEVLNEISIDTGYGLDDIAKDKFISTQLFTKILTDGEIKKFKYDFEVQKQIIYLFGVSNDQKEIGLFCLLYTSPSPRDQRGSRMPSSA